MPRGARLDAPGAVHHVCARGIERKEIFVDDIDREDFLQRLEHNTRGIRAFVYAWALIPNHFHLAIRTGTEDLASIMRRLMTGYAVAFNRRHKRHGHLFQNRYKSTIVDDDAYLLTLVRYIHRNPLRAGLVKSVEALARYPWCGHSSLMGTIERLFQDNEEILGRFGTRVGKARNRLVAFIEDQGDAKKQEHIFKGGGLVRSAGGLGNLIRSKKSDRQMFDERILGDGQFVEEILRKAGSQGRAVASSSQDKDEKLKTLQNKICKRLKISMQSLTSGSRDRQIVKARIILIYLAIRYLGFKGKDLAEVLGVSTTAVSRSIQKGETELKNNVLEMEEFFN